ncbi:NAD-dependent epimerase/dehydratase family protein [Arthrobacter gengyunqii]|uniref:NAD-dependent epimerase/dehydratase family protein n=1 Tax=Arthrobacter gengyunqii TaxID=2886940 RepID=A0ABS8GIT1_9MICC|nr:NAD-dependent epimerase/dehydratase family protein [Arthrobacter gengyunqii]MCC3266572.1 NAD-dependent epimerase/dehydratase family protein [Arthrobacter gengyunqii]
MKALVTGAAGFVGSNISRRLISEGMDVVGIDAITDYYDPEIKLRNLQAIGNRGFTFIHEDLNHAALGKLLDGVDYIFHQAGQPGVRKSWGKDFSTYLDANVHATQRLLEHCKDSSTLKRFVYASSSSVYGDAATFPTSEDQLPQPLSPYGVSKLAAEHLCSLYAANFGVPTVSLRYFTVYGPGQRPDMAFTRFVKAIIQGTPIEIYGSGNQIRDFTYVDDIVEANLRAALRPSPKGSIFNVAGGSNISVNEAIVTLERLMGHELKRNYVGRVAGDVVRTGGDTTKIKATLDWSPHVSLEEGLQRHLAWGKGLFAKD